MAKQTVAERVALALAKVNPLAGLPVDGLDVTLTVEERAENLLRSGKYGPYVAEGDPNEWGTGKALATIYMEPKGTEDDVVMPLAYYGNGFDMAAKASDILGDLSIEFVNAAVACVYKV